MLRLLDRWYIPLLFLIFLPVMTVPATQMIQDQFLDGSCKSIRSGPHADLHYDCPTLLVIAARAPGLLGFASLLWFRSKSPAVRQAAWVATGLAALRVYGPAFALLTDGGVTWVMSIFAGSRMVTNWLSLLLWLVSLEVLFTHYLWGRPRPSFDPEQLFMGVFVLAMIVGYIGLILSALL